MSRDTPRAEERDSDLKFGRAKKHLKELDSAKNQYLSGNPFQALRESSSSKWIWRLDITTPPPAELTLICGDIIHNLRSALEYRVVEIARNVLGRKLSEAEEKALAFPVTGEEKDFDKRIKKWNEVFQPRGGDIAQCVLVFQPFAKPSGYLDYLEGDSSKTKECRIKEEQSAIFERLHRLNWLSNMDKHRRLNLLLVSLSWSSMSGIPDPSRLKRRPNPLEHKDIIMTLPSEDASNLTPEQVSPNLELRLERRYSPYELTPIEGSFDFHAELENISWYVCEALKILEYEEVRILSS